MPRLVGHSSELTDQIFDLSGPVVTIGRTANNTIHLPDNSLSSHHAELRIEDFDYVVRDLDSTNGTRVNGERVTTSALRSNDVVRFGNVEFVYESEHAAETVPLPEINPGISLDGCISRGRPAHFLFAGQPSRAKEKEPVPWNLLIVAAAILAVFGLLFFIFNLMIAQLPG